MGFGMRTVAELDGLKRTPKNASLACKASTVIKWEKNDNTKV